MVMKLYALADGPPSLAVRQALAYLEIPHEKIEVDFLAGDHLTEKYALVTAWYEGFKKNYPELWKISEEGMKFTQAFIENSRKSS